MDHAPTKDKSTKLDKATSKKMDKSDGDKPKRDKSSKKMGAENSPQATSGIDKLSAEAGIVIPNAVEEMSYAALAWEVAKQIGGNLSGDLLNSGISLPTNMMEPLTILQRGLEIFEYLKCLEKAAKCKSSINRMAFIAGFSASPFANSPDRFKTNFNPILGETFEYIDARFKSPVKCFAEQVSHHPPMAAMHAFNKNWKFCQQYGCITNFMGNQLDLRTDAQTHIYFPNGEHYYSTNPRARVHNVAVGTMWLEHYGEIEIVNLTTGEKCVIEFPKAGFFDSAPTTNISGYIYDKEGKKIVKLQGRWDDHLIGQWLVDTEDKGFVKGAKIQLWKLIPTDWKDGRPYKMSNYSMTFNYFPDDLKKHVLTSDSRRRLDRYFLEKADCESATQWKRVAEYRQRMDEADRKAAAKKGDQEVEHTKDYWTPNWFTNVNDHRGKPFWEFTDKYWDVRAKVEETGEPHIPANIKDTSCDFMHYEKNFKDLVGNTVKLGDRGINL